MRDEQTKEAPEPERDERAIRRKFGLREVVYPNREQVKALVAFLSDAVQTRRCGKTPKMAVLVMLEYLQHIVNLQYVSKREGMLQEEFDILRRPYDVAARVVSEISGGREPTISPERTYVTLNQFVELLHSLIDPECQWMRLSSVPDVIREVMETLLAFINRVPGAAQKGQVA